MPPPPGAAGSRWPAGRCSAAFGATFATGAAALGSFPLLLVALALAGASSATNLQARFAATDLAQPTHRARDLSVVVWSTTAGAVLGPNLIEPGEAIGSLIGLPTLTGPFVFTVAAQLAAMAVYFLGLRPDPLLTAIGHGPAPTGIPPRKGLATLRVNSLARYSVVAVALSHATMVAMMSMTPVHLYGHGATLAIVGFTISLHIAGMYALSPVFGALADRFGRLQVILTGQGLLFASLVVAWLGSESDALVGLSLILLGLGWSAATIAGIHPRHRVGPGRRPPRRAGHLRPADERHGGDRRRPGRAGARPGRLLGARHRLHAAGGRRRRVDDRPDARPRAGRAALALML